MFISKRKHNREVAELKVTIDRLQLKVCDALDEIDDVFNVLGSSKGTTVSKKRILEALGR